MDYVLEVADEYVFSPYVYPSSIPTDNILRQLCSLTVVTILGGYALYLITAAASYYFLFDERLLLHPQSLKDQVRREITCSVRSIPLMSFISVLVFLAEVRGYSRLFDSFDETVLGKWSILTYSISFILFTDSLIYWIHRGLHSRYLYKRLHKTHHTWKIPTPFASHAFHPLDGFFQSVPYHLYVFLFPMHKWTYLGLFVFVNVWTVSIHDGNYMVPKKIREFINGSAHHMDHHVFYNYNYGQFFTLWDRIGRSYRNPSSFEGTGPIADVERLEKKAASAVQDVVRGETSVRDYTSGDLQKPVTMPGEDSKTSMTRRLADASPTKRNTYKGLSVTCLQDDSVEKKLS